MAIVAAIFIPTATSDAADADHEPHLRTPNWPWSRAGPSPNNEQSDGTEAPVLRRDAARNRVKIMAAARAVFDEEGVDVCVEVIAQRAGVGVGTLYRRFPTKELLIEAVIDEVLEGVLTAGQDALANESPADGFAEFIRAVGWLQFDMPAA